MSKAEIKWQEIIEKELKMRSGTLNLPFAGLDRIPEEIRKMDWLTQLDLSSNEINKIEGLEALENLESLYLAGNQIKKIEGLNELKNLKILYLGINQIEHIEGLTTLKDLQELVLIHNKIKVIEGLFELKNLNSLNLNFNLISKIEGISGLTKLEKIDLTNNQILKIEGLSGLPKLNTIILTENKIKSIYPILPLLKKGLPLFLDTSSVDSNFIALGGNPIADPPMETIMQGTPAILKYFAEKKKYRFEKLEILKIILVGNSQVGKTNFSQFLREGIINSNTTSTHVLDIQKWDADFLVSEKGTKTRLHLFDFGGQDYYHDAHRMYYSYDTAYILIWDTLSNEYMEMPETVDGAEDIILYENFPLPYWLQSINYSLDGKYLDTYHTPLNENDIAAPPPETKTKAPPILVLQNKIDISIGKLNQEELSEKYPNIWSYFGVSLLKKKRTDVLKELLSDYLSSLNLTGRMLLSYQLEIVKYFTDNADKELKIYTLTQFKEACINIIKDESVEFEERDALIMAHILNNTGIVLFQQEENESYIYSDIGILNEQIKTIMDAARKGSDKGVFHMKDVLQGQDNHNKEKILQLLSGNKSIIKLNETEYLSPQFLPTEADDSIRFFLHTFNHVQMRYVYPAYYHKSILLNLFAEYVGSIKENFSLSSNTFPFWRNGIIVSENTGNKKEMVFIEFVKNKNHAIINIKTMVPFLKRKLPGKIERLIDSLNKGWTVTKEVSIDSEIFIPVEKLLEKFKTRQFEFVREDKRFKINDFKELVDFENRPKRIFISYSSLDKDYLNQFTSQIISLRNEGLVETWDDRELQAGDKWDIVIREQLDKADFVILFISANFLNSTYIKDVELKKALENNQRIIPIIIDFCTWNYDTVLKDVQVLNKEFPLTSYSPISKGWVEVVKALKAILEK